jgi:hypothetical protein
MGDVVPFLRFDKFFYRIPLAFFIPDALTVAAHGKDSF